MNEQEKTDSGQADYEGDEAWASGKFGPGAERTAWLDGVSATMVHMGPELDYVGRLDTRTNLFVFERGENNTGSYFVTPLYHAKQYYLVLGGGVIGEVTIDGEK